MSKAKSLPAGRQGFSPILAVVIVGLVLVAAVGLVVYLQTSEPAQPEQATGIPSQNQDMTAGWQTYTNTEYGFEFKYPKEWTLESPNSETINLYRYIENPDERQYDGMVYLRVFDPYISANEPAGDRPNIVSLEERKINNITFSREIISFGTGTNLSYRTVQDDFGIQVDVYSYVNGSTGTGDEFDDLLDQIISTFKFIDSQTAGWQTYKDEEYGFEFKYKPTYNIEVNYDHITGPDDVLGQSDIVFGDFLEFPRGSASMSKLYYQLTIKKGISSLDALKSFYVKFPLASPLTNLTLAGQEAVGMRFYQEVGAGRHVYAVGTIRNNTAYILSIWKSDETASEDEFNKILSTFKFIEE